MKSFPVLALALAMLGTPAYSAVINAGSSGLVAPQKTITFSELTFNDGDAISNQFSPFGVTFSANLYFRNASSWEDQGINSQNLRTGDPITKAFSMKFNNVVSQAAFASIASPSANPTITARLRGVDVESFTTVVDLDNNSWMGFTGIQFDEINITYPDETRLRIDNLQLGAPVPEPGAGVLAGLALLGLTRRGNR